MGISTSDHYPMRYAIIGNSGSGKSTLARQLGQSIGVTPIDLDEIYWESDQPGVARDLAVAEQLLRERLDGQEGWIIEGCYDDLIGSVLDLNPQLIWLDPGKAVCLQHCRERPWESHKYPSKSAQDRNLPMLLQWVSDHYSRTGAMSYHAHKQLFEQFSGSKEIRRE